MMTRVTTVTVTLLLAGILTVTLLLAGILLRAVSEFGAGQTRQSSEVGRFQLFEATFTALDAMNNRADKETAVFLLDTSTGKVTRYSTGLYKNGKGFEHWVPTEER